ncbi:MAG: toxic anion resistance protein [Trichococcus flocculiformis]|uniref:Toxic anion resistance protein n=1 Tax=Trichococcus flocculiformis TaxID=82803 RepID=A0A847D4V8_9LACT|nr:toxic anion resistance protein [Trichococcus flocculiformis]NLD31660.1 toxic anion resistance protein [Trichococcus flocculiformis]
MDQFDATGQNKQTDSKNVNQELEDLLANPFSDPFAQPAVVADATEATAEVINPDRLIDRLSEERQKQALALAGQIDENNMQAIISYGAAAQKQLGEFSHSMLDHVQNQDTGEIGDSLNDLMYRLNEAKPEDLRAEDNNVFRKIFGKVKQSAYEMTAKYQKIGAQIDKIAIKLDKEKNSLLNDNITLEQLYQKNKDYFEALNIYIAAGEVKMEDLQKNAIPKAIQTAEASQSQMDVQIVNDLKQFLDRLEKRTHDLRLTRQMTIQQAPQIRLIQNTNQALAEKIQSSIHTAIPLWKNQVAIALTLLRQKDAVTAQRQVSQTTNDLMRKNSEMLKISAIETAKENERGVIDIETLKQTQQDLIETLEETLKIQQEGRIKRKEAEKELSMMEDDLKVKLLNIHQQEQQLH